MEARNWRCVVLVSGLYLVSTQTARAQCWNQEAKLQMGTPQGGDGFGYSVGIFGDTAVVGTPYDENSNGDNAGAVRFFQRDIGGPNAWGKLFTKLSPKGNTGDQLGTSVSISGNTVAAGGIYAGSLGSGAVSVFERDFGGPSAWGESAFLTPSTPQFNEAFGQGVSIDGDTLVAGAPWNDVFGPSSGTAYVFERDWGGPGTWGEVVRLLPADNSGGFFGNPAVISQDTIVVGALGNNGGTGAAYVFERNLGGPNAWGERIKLTASDGSAVDLFGASIALNGDLLVVGSYYDDDHGDDSGAVYFYERNLGGPNAWGELMKITPADGEPHDNFGAGVSLLADMLFVTAPGDNEFNVGSVYVFERDLGGPGAWGELVEFGAFDTDPLGAPVSVYGTTLLVGSWHVNPIYEGAAWIFERGSDSVRYCTPGTSASGCQAIVTACGTPSATASSGFTLAVEDLEGSSHGLFFFGSNGRQANSWGNSSSFQCVVPPVHRTGVMKGVGTPGACDGSFSKDFNAYWQQKPNHNPGAGALVQAQLWYRDKDSTSNQTTSFSDAIEVLVTP
jgi:hypothetical protein